MIYTELILKLHLLSLVFWQLCLRLYPLGENNHTYYFWMKYFVFLNFSYVQKVLNLQSVRIKTTSRDHLPLQLKICSEIKLHVTYKTEKNLQIILSLILSFCKTKP